MSSKDFNLFDDGIFSLDETNWMDIERSIREYLYELNMKRKLLEDARRELNESETEKNELKIKLECEKRKLENNVQENIKESIMLTKLQEEREQNKEFLIKNKLEFEITKKERDSLKIQNNSQQIEIERLKKQLENSEGLYKCHLTYQRDVMNEQNKIKSLFTELAIYRGNMENINKKYDEYLKKLEICRELKQSVELYAEKNRKLTKEKNELQKQLIIKSTEIDMFQDLLKRSPFNIKTYQDEIDYWKQKLKEQKEKYEQLFNTATIISTTLELEKGISEHLKVLLEKYDKKTNEAEVQTENIMIIKKEIDDIEINETIRIESETNELETIQIESEMIRTGPEMIRNEPEMIRNESEMIRNESEMIRNEPEMIRNESEMIRNESEMIQNEPEMIQIEPEMIQTEPEKIRSESEMIQTEPETNIIEPRTITAEPKTILIEPKKIQMEAKTNQNESEVIQIE